MKYIKSSGGYYYKEYANGKRSRISLEEYNKKKNQFNKQQQDGGMKFPKIKIPSWRKKSNTKDNIIIAEKINASQNPRLKDPSNVIKKKNVVIEPVKIEGNEEKITEEQQKITDVAIAKPVVNVNIKIEKTNEQKKKNQEEAEKQKELEEKKAKEESNRIINNLKKEAKTRKQEAKKKEEEERINHEILALSISKLLDEKK